MHAINILQNRTLESDKEKIVIQCAFLLLFPGFFFYQTLLGLGMISAFLGGYFTFVALVLVPALLYIYMGAVRKQRNYFLKWDLAYLLLLLYFSVVLVVNFASGADSMIVQRYIQGIIFCVEIYIIFRMIDLDDKKFIFLLVICLVIMSLITIYFSIDGFFYLQALDQAKSPENLATYQGFARSYFYTFLILISVSKSIGTRLLLYATATATLFLNGARSEFVAVLFTVPLVEIYYLKHKIFSVVPFAYLLILLGVNAGSIVGSLPDNRTLQLLDLSHSSSAVARQHLSRDAWRTITENPIFGDFASYPDGHYAHNMLCAWVDFGFLGFFFFGALLIWPAFHLYSNGYFEKEKSSEFVLACAFISIAILWAITAKNVPDMSVGAAMGALARYQYGKRNLSSGSRKRTS